MSLFEQLIVKSNTREKKQQTVGNISQNAINVRIDRNNIKNVRKYVYCRCNAEIITDVTIAGI